MSTPRTRPRWSRRRWVLVVGAVLLAIAVVAAWFAFSGATSPRDPDTERVRAARTDQTTTVSLSGVLAPQQQSNVSFAVPGTVQRIAVEVGERVSAGQELATIEDRDLRNALALAEAQLEAARASLRTVLDADGASAQVAAARAQVTSAQVSVDQARDRVDDATLASPIDGVVAEVGVEVGDQVTGTGGLGSSGLGAGLPSGMGGGLPNLSGMGLGNGSAAQRSGSAAATAGGANFVVVVPDTWKLEASVGTADLPSLQPGQPAIVTPTGTSTHVAAVVETVGIVASSQSGSAATFPVTLTVTDPTADLFSGSNADAVITTGTVRDVLTLPERALWYVDDRPTVRRPTVTGVDVVDVTTGRRFGELVEVTGGVAEGDEVLARKGVAVSAPPRPQFGPNGTLASPDPTPSR